MADDDYIKWIINLFFNGSQPFCFSFLIRNLQLISLNESKIYSLQWLELIVFFLIQSSDNICIGQRRPKQKQEAQKKWYKNENENL